MVKQEKKSNQASLFDGIDDLDDRPESQDKAFSKLCRIKDWRSKVILEYKSLF
jgi:hypothetical protein